MEEVNQTEDTQLVLLQEENKRLQTECNKLNNYCIQFSNQVNILQGKVNELTEALQDADKAESYARMNLLCRVVEGTAFDSDFVENCAKEIKSFLFPKKTE